MPSRDDIDGPVDVVETTHNLQTLPASELHGLQGYLHSASTLEAAGHRDEETTRAAADINQRAMAAV
jgi:hypothetical protein